MEKLKERIKESGLKQNYIADKCGVGHAHFSMMINGTATMPEHVRNKINELLAKVSI